MQIWETFYFSIPVQALDYLIQKAVIRIGVNLTLGEEEAV